MRGLMVVVGVAWVAGCSGDPVASRQQALGAPDASASLPDLSAAAGASGQTAAQLVDLARALFRAPTRVFDPPGFGRPPAPRSAIIDLRLGPSSDGSSDERLRVTLPARADLETTVEDVRKTMTHGLTIVGAAAASAERVDELTVYRDVFPGVAVISRGGGYADDFLFFQGAPAQARVEYDLSLDPGIGGLRLVENTLEVLDPDGIPLLHMSPPALIDAKDHVAATQVSVSGCAVDIDPAFPWHRAPVAPGASTCRIAISWNDPALTYPALLDPLWTYSDTLDSGRSQFAMAAMPALGACNARS